MAGLDRAIQPGTLCSMACAWVYIMASRRNGTLYIGVTKDLGERITQHKNGQGSAFCRRYGVNMLVWYERHDLVSDAIQRETSLKRWQRAWKLELIEKLNPDWRDLALDNLGSA
jgi:putative endonuclease